MKRISLIVSVVLCCLFFTTCKRYPDGPIFSLRTVNNRLLGTYELEKYIVNGIDSTGLLPPCKNLQSLKYGLTDGHYCYEFKPDEYLDGLDGNGGFLLSNDRKQIDIDYTVCPSCKNTIHQSTLNNYWWEIRKLTIKEFWIKKVQDGVTYELHLKKIHKL